MRSDIMFLPYISNRNLMCVTGSGPVVTLEPHGKTEEFKVIPSIIPLVFSDSYSKQHN